MPAKNLLDEFQSLWKEADAIWTRHDQALAFEGYVSADYQAVYQSLLPFQNRGMTFLEWGAGLGVVAIMASRMGFEAYGIEAESELVEYAQTLALAFDSSAQFAHGSFIPDDFEWNLSEGNESERTQVDVPAAYESLELELQDFDLIYAYPWPNEHRLFHNIVRQYGRRHATLLTYCVREGIQVVRFDS